MGGAHNVIREVTTGYARALAGTDTSCRGGAAEGWAGWRAPFRSTSLRAEEPAANDAAGPKNGQAGKVVPGGHWAASGALISATNPRARKPWWLGGSLPNLATHGAIFARNRVPARNADHT